MELMTRIELVNLILTKDALYRLSYISAATKRIIAEDFEFDKPFLQIFSLFFRIFLKSFFVVQKSQAEAEKNETALTFLSRFCTIDAVSYPI